MKQQSEQWGSRAGFILAAVGSAIGLGNIWRYPYVVYENGGGAFLVPYFIALLTAGIPILLLEYTLGHRFRGSAPLSYRRLSKNWEWLGWFQVLLSFVIVSYYMVIIGWALSYSYFSFGTKWGTDTESFFFNDFLAMDTKGEAFWSTGSISWPVLISVAIIWAVTYAIMRRGARSGIEKAAKILMPLLVLMLLIVTLRGVTLEGASEGLNVLFTPDFSMLTNFDVWIAAYGQVFFSLSIGFATMITYASYLKKDQDLTNSGLIAAFANSGFEFLAAIGIFGALGFLAATTGTDVENVVSQSIGLAFVVFPQIINAFPGFNSLFGVLFFGSLVFAGLTSAISLLEPGVAALRDKLGISRTKAVNWLCGIAALVSVLYSTGGGIYFLDVVDHFTNQYGLLIGALLEVIAIAWVTKQLGFMHTHINYVSDIRLGAWWKWILFITPLILGGLAAKTLYGEISAGEPYGGSLGGMLVFGLGSLGLALVLGFVLQGMKWKTDISFKREEGKEHAS
ncbi:sodium-dependent transporter [Mechercharimyces sp. CAU 1602]|uniref:sodium-dependent transporter n=1 Tax=Mechercharimyces sp. CAU 1602 TaxID=2973933 RepID=UPI0021620CF1|nr:sodium-dependent transporter [Mechercharimyces sp. CAU 1602]MCS1351794.1 sodium-dependent transporter [Mechercharimyces sp. CAU 1602]